MDKSVDPIRLMDYLSGGNHELFHSNLLVYIGKRYPKLFLRLMDIDVVEYPELENFDPKNLRREYRSLDISITDKDDNFLLVVENKMKCFPNKKQLEKYENKVKNKKGYRNKCCFRLLSLKDVGKSQELEPWQVISYSQLKENLAKHWLNNKSASTYLESRLPEGERKYFSNLLIDYISYINELNEVLDPKKIENDVTSGNFSILYYNEEEDKNNKWRHLMQRKLRFEAMKSLIENDIIKGIKKYAKKNNKDKFKILESLSFDAGVTRATPFMELAIAFDRNNGDLVKNPTISQSEHEIYYWLQVYQGEVQRGFALRINEELSKEFNTGQQKKEVEHSGNKTDSKDNEEIGESTEHEEPMKFDRQDYIKKIWKVCKEIPVFKTIATDCFVENFCHDCFVPIPEKGKRLRGYLYKDFAMVFIPTGIEKTKLISDFISEITKEITGLLKMFSR